ncbi:MAG TPA: glycoside hydrolase family protein [Polyangia bacterium]|nr:glycoside hydrolase family protein [Polyangia bacterium]
MRRFVRSCPWLLAAVGFVGCAAATTGAGTGGSGGATGTGGQAGAAGQVSAGGVSGAMGTGGFSDVGGKGGSAGRGGGGAGRGGASGSLDTGGVAGAGGSGSTCKRGIAANTAPGAAFYPAVRWWYNWSLTPAGGNTGIEFVPMVWGSSTVNGAIPAGSRYLLGFNEPNFMSQANLTPQAAAAAWPMLQTNGRRAGVLAIVGPGMNFCGPAASCNGTDPYVYLADFLNACTSCEVDHIAAHWYNCDLPSLKAYIESNSSLAGWVQFGKPIWLTEFSCDDSATEAQQEAFMRAAIPYLESQPNVFRYSWFSADPIPNGKLINSDGSPTALGQVYISLPSNCP